MPVEIRHTNARHEAFFDHKRKLENCTSFPEMKPSNDGIIDRRSA